MEKNIFAIFFFLLLINFSNGQGFKYAWIISPDIGKTGADTTLTNIIDNINLYKDIKFVIVSGNLTVHGKNDELQQIKSILDKLNIPYYVIPGENDLSWSESAGEKINSIFGESHFMFKQFSTLQMGLNNVVTWRNGAGHFPPEEMSWVSDTLKSFFGGNEIFLYSNFPFDSKTDNWFQLTNKLFHLKVTALFSANGKPNSITSNSVIPVITGKSTFDSKYWYYNIIENQNDSLFFFEVKNGIAKQWGSYGKQILDIAKIDTIQFLNYSEYSETGSPKLKAKVSWREDFNTTLLTDLYSNGSDIFVTSESGDIYCYDISGKKLWEYDSKEIIVGRPIVSSNILAVATLQGDLISLNAKTGVLIQVIGIGEPLTSQLVTTQIEYNGSLTTGVIVGTSKGSLYCYSMDSFEMIWENHSAKGLIRDLPLIKDHRLFYGSQDGFLYCIDDRTGVLYWKWNEGNDFYTAPVVCTPLSDGNAVYLSTPDKYVSKIDFLLGVTKWRKKFDSWESLGLSNDSKNLIVKSISNNIYFVSARDGNKIRTVNLKYGFDLNPSKPLEWKGNYLISAENGNVYLIDSHYNSRSLLFLGNCRLNSVINIKNNIFAVSNMDGKIICFELN